MPLDAASPVPPRAPEAAFALRGISLLYPGAGGVRDISLQIRPGERVGLVGPSGGGKTTLLTLMNAMAAPQSGELRLFGESLSGKQEKALQALRRRIGAIPQHDGLVPSFSALQNVATGRLGSVGFWRGLRSVYAPNRAEEEAIYKLLRRVGVGDKLFQRTDKLSGGERQRVAIARALYQAPDALLADEPVASLDPARADDVLALLTDLAEERALTLCVSLHNLPLAQKYLPRLIGVKDGAIAFDAPTEKVTPAMIEALYAF